VGACAATEDVAVNYARHAAKIEITARVVDGPLRRRVRRARAQEQPLHYDTHGV